MKTKLIYPSLLIIALITLNLIIFKQQPPSIYYAETIWNTSKISGEQFYKTQCAFCHTSEELIAPDMNKIKVVYKAKYKTKEAFVKAVTAFVKNPAKKNAIYKEGIDNFTDMPKMPFKDTQIKATVEYIFSADKL